MYKPASEPPLGSRIVVDTDENGQARISWPLPDAGFDFWHDVGCLILTICMWCALLALGIAMTYDLSKRDGAGAWICCAAPLLLFLGLGMGMVMKLWNGLRPPRSASIVLGTVSVLYDAGRKRFDSPGIREWFGSSSVRAFNCLEITNVRLDRVGERQRLSIDVGFQRIEIGGSLTEPEREWLVGVLRQWAGLDPTPTATELHFKKWRST